MIYQTKPSKLALILTECNDLLVNLFVHLAECSINRNSSNQTFPCQTFPQYSHYTVCTHTDTRHKVWFNKYIKKYWISYHTPVSSGYQIFSSKACNHMYAQIKFSSTFIRRQYLVWDDLYRIVHLFTVSLKMIQQESKTMYKI